MSENNDVVPDVLSSGEEILVVSHVAEYSTKQPESRKNPKNIVCSRCGSKVLLPDTATQVKKNVFLPLMTFKATVPPTSSSANSSEELPAALHFLPDVPGEVLEDFWLVTDMYAFENVGVSHTVGSLKYLTCADCEIGPIGFQDLEKKDEFLVAWNRVGEN